MSKNSHQPSRRLTIKSVGATRKRYVKSLSVNGVRVGTPVLFHEQIAAGGEIVFEMSDEVQEWGNNPDILKSLFN